MDKKLQRVLYILVVLGIVFMVFLLRPYVLPIVNGLLAVLAPFIVAFAIAFVLHPLVKWLEGHKWKRTPSVLAVVLGIIIIGIAFFGSFLPLVFRQLLDVLDMAPDLINRAQAYLETETDFFSMYDIESIDWPALVTSGFETTGELVSFIIPKVTSGVSFTLITPILLVYILHDYDKIRENLKSFIKRHKWNRLYGMLKEYEDLLSRYVGGLLLVMIVLTIISTILFSIAGLDNALLFGFIIGLTNIIPLIGNIIGGAIAVIFGLSQSFTLAVIILVEIVVLVFVEGNIVTPAIQGKSVNISPLVIILGISVFGYIFGFFGILLAIPFIVLVKLILKHYFEEL